MSVGFKDRGILCQRCILQQVSLGRSVDETHCLPRPAPFRTSQTQKEVVSGSLSPCDAFRVPTNRKLLVVGVTQKLWHISVENYLIPYLYVLVSPCLCRISAKKTCLAFLIVLLHLPFSTPVICSGVPPVQLLISCLCMRSAYKIVGICNILSLRALLVYPLITFNASRRVHNKPYDHRLHKSIS